MKTCVIFALLCTLGISGCVHNRQVTLAQTHSAVMDSLPAAVKSLPIQIIPSFEHRALAWTTVGMMESYVSYNPDIAKKLPSDVLAFALVHEYAHLRFNHINPLSFEAKSAAAIRQQELEADRFAARFWATNDARVAEAAAEAFLSPAGNRALGSENLEHNTGYPTRKERAQAILDYLAEAQRSSSLKSP